MILFFGPSAYCPWVYGQSAVQIDYVRDIQPLLSDRCFVCHGPDAARREADLRLDVEQAAKESAIVAGHPEQSELIRRITSADEAEVMPPPESNLELSTAERQMLAAWVAAGANFSEHWSFVPPKKFLPAGSSGNTQYTLVDRCVEPKLQKLGLSLSDQADRATLIRRLSFDLTGLPPAPEEVRAFVADQTPGAYERLVDRLLASRQYGERMAVDWLDVARYADTYGYQNDRYRAMWPWRDWVIEAFNKNLPYDDFVTWQLAGDLLPNATTEQILATAFNRNHRQTNEGGSVEEEFRAEYVADRVNTFGAAFLGLTLECCRCHDHKYDPITQREYYQLASYFNSIDESGLYSHFTEATPTPTLKLFEAEDRHQMASISSEIQRKEMELSALMTEDTLRSDYRAWKNKFLPPGSDMPLGLEGELLDEILKRSSTSLLGEFSFEVIEGGRSENEVQHGASVVLHDSPVLIEGRVGKALELDGENSITTEVGGAFSRDDPFTVSLWIKTPKHFDRAVILHRSRAWTDSGSRGYELLIEDGRLSAALVHFWPGNAIRVRSNQALPLNTWVNVSVRYDGSSHASGLSIFLDGRRAESEVVRDCLTKHIGGADGVGGGNVSEVTLGQRFRDVGFAGGSVDQLRIYDRDLSPLEIRAIYSRDAKDDASRDIVDEAQLWKYFVMGSGHYQRLRTELLELRRQRSGIADKVAEIMVMKEMPEPRPTFILMRGAYDAPGEPVERGTLSRIKPESPGPRSTRLDLANWLVSPENPLTARVAVNRFWQMLFGRGLVVTSEDFGLQGSVPEYPELLDSLSVEFVESGWDIKSLIKQIVMSRVYRQRSEVSPELRERDPENELLARGPVVRLSAEMIRDAALSASGLLVDKVGGPPVKPYQPEGLWEEKSGLSYTRDEGEGSHRRSIYTYWKRTSPPPAMMTLDSANREVCTVRRQVTLTPLQVLVLLNDPQYVEASRALAHLAVTQASDVEDRLEVVFERLVGKLPSVGQMEILSAMYGEQLSYFESHPEAVSALNSVGDFKVDAESVTAELAALTVVAEGLMSFDGVITKR